MDEELARSLDHATQGIHVAHEASSSLRQAFPADSAPSALTQALIHALDYDGVGPDELERRAQWGPFAPIIETTAGVYPERLSEVTEDRRAEWGELYTNLVAPVSRARLADLLWELRWGDSPHLYARGAIEAYTEIAQSAEPSTMEIADALSRALQLARVLNDAALMASVSDACMTAAREALASDEHTPGVVLGLIEALTRLPAAHQSADLDALIESTYQRYQADPWLATTIIAIALSRAAKDAAAQHELVERNIDAWVKASEATTGLVASTHLERAIDLARQYNRAEIAESLRLRLQEVSKSVDLTAVGTTVEMPRERVEEYLSRFVDTDDAAQAFARFGAHCPLPENRDATADFVRQLMADHPLQYLFTKVILGPGNLPLKYVSSPEEHFISAMNQHEAMSIGVWGLFAADVLDRIAEKFAPTREMVREFFETSELTAPVAGRLAEAFELYWEGRHDTAMLTAIPRLETIIRDMSRGIGLVTWVEPQANQPGRQKGLGQLLSGLAGRFDERRRHYLLTLLSNPLGFNLRNDALHGLLIEGSREQAALALHAATLLGLFSLNVESGSV